jgi:predicted phage terminase large subunit-like protein
VSSNQRLKTLLIPKLTKYIPHTPTPKQTAFLLLLCEDAFYGGAAGGGKSDALLMAALQYVDVPNYAALLLRDSYASLSKPGALIERADQWLSNTDAHWSEQNKTWHFPSGATISFGYLAGPRDHLNYKSAEFQFIGIDEAGDLRWKQMMYMFSRLRRLEGSIVPIRFRLTSNPGGVSHEELKSKYIDPITREPGLVFIQAGLKDNPYLDRKEYVKSLAKLDPVTRRQLLDGNWDIKESGRMFQREWFKIIDQAPVECYKVRYWDLAATKPKKEGHEPAWTVGLKMLKDKNNICYIENIERKRETPLVIESTVRQRAQLDGIETTIYMEQEPGSGGVNNIDHYRRDILAGYNFKADKVSVNKEERAKPFSSYAEAGNVYLVNGPWVKKFLDEIEMFPDGKFKDQVDSASGAFIALFGGSVEPRVRWI